MEVSKKWVEAEIKQDSTAAKYLNWRMDMQHEDLLPFSTFDYVWNGPMIQSLVEKNRL